MADAEIKVTYWVQLDGDYAEPCDSLDRAEDVRSKAFGHVAVEDRTITRETIITVTEIVK